MFYFSFIKYTKQIKAFNESSFFCFLFGKNKNLQKLFLNLFIKNCYNIIFCKKIYFYNILRLNRVFFYLFV